MDVDQKNLGSGGVSDTSASGGGSSSGSSVSSGSSGSSGNSGNSGNSGQSVSGSTGNSNNGGTAVGGQFGGWPPGPPFGASPPWGNGPPPFAGNGWSFSGPPGPPGPPGAWPRGPGSGFIPNGPPIHKRADAKNPCNGNSNSNQGSTGNGKNSGSVDSSKSTLGLSSNPSTKVVAHAVLACLSFGFLFPTGAISMRLLHVPGLLWIHGAFQVFTAFLFTIAFAIGIILAKDLDYVRYRRQQANVLCRIANQRYRWDNLMQSLESWCGSL
jgi:hypothetical protein